MTACSCEKCVSLCRQNPGWFAPEEARAAIAAGLAGKLMLDYFTGRPPIFLLCPASAGLEGKRAPNTEELLGVDGLLSALLLNSFSMKSKGACVFLDGDRCRIHDSGFKPVQCRTSLACQPYETSNSDFNLKTAERWNNPEAQALVREWMATVGLSESELAQCLVTDYAERRHRVAIQVWERWTDGGLKLNGETEEATMAAVERAADASFRAGINDLDWEAATLRLLDDGGN